MLFRILHDTRSGELGYLIAHGDSREAALIDPRPADLPLLLALLGDHELRLRWVLRTHQHDALTDPAPGARPQAALALLRQMGAPVVQGACSAGDTCPADGTALCLGSDRIHVLHTPGHTPDCLSFQWRDRVFCGGLLAMASCPHQPQPADPAALWDSAQRLFTLPDETLLFAGHHPRLQAVSTVLEQRRWHPQLAGTTRDGFLARAAVGVSETGVSAAPATF